MSGFILDMNKHDKPSSERTFEQLPAGRYHAMIIDDREHGGAFQRTSQAGNLMYRLTVMVIDPRDTENSRFRGWSFFDNLLLTEKSIWRTIQLYRAVEPEETNRKTVWDVGDADQFHAEMFYKPMVVDVKHRSYNGKTYPEIKGFYPITSDSMYNKCLDSANALIDSGKAGNGPREAAQSENTGDDNAHDFATDTDVPF